MKAARNQPLLWLIPLVTLMGSAIVASHKVPLWVPRQCTWAFRDPDWLMALPSVGFIALLYLVYLRLTHLPESGAAIRKASLVGLVCLIGLLLSLSLRLSETLGFARLAVVTINPASGGFFTAAYDTVDRSDWLHQYPEMMKDYHHVTTHPPGMVALMRFWLHASGESSTLVQAGDRALAVSPGADMSSIAAFSAGAWQRPYTSVDAGAAFWGGLTTLVAAALIPACIYVQSHVLFGHAAAAAAAAVAAFVPSLLLFAPSADLVYAFLSALALAVAAMGAARRNVSLLVIAGVIVGIGLVFSFALSAIAVLISGFLLLQARENKPLLLKLLGGFLLGIIATVGAIRLLGVDWLAIWRTMNNVQAKEIIKSGRDYKTWLFFNLADFFLFVGLPVTILVISGFVRSLRERKSLFALLVPALGVILITDLLGYTPAETARIWMLFMPSLIAVAGGVIAASGDNGGKMLPKVVLLSQALQLLVFSQFVNVWLL